GAAQCGDDYVGPETGAILAHPPAFVFEATFALRDVQFQLWKARINSLSWVKGRERFAEDFIGGVAFDPLGSLVPTHNAALGIEHEDGVILHAPNQQLETLFAPAQFFLCATLLDRTAVHVSGAGQVASLGIAAGPQRRRHGISHTYRQSSELLCTRLNGAKLS